MDDHFEKISFSIQTLILDFNINVRILTRLCLFQHVACVSSSEQTTIKKLIFHRTKAINRDYSKLICLETHTVNRRTQRKVSRSCFFFIHTMKFPIKALRKIFNSFCCYPEQQLVFSSSFGVLKLSEKIQILPLFNPPRLTVVHIALD